MQIMPQSTKQWWYTISFRHYNLDQHRFSTNIDTLYNAIGAGRYVPGAPRADSERSESEGHSETRSEVFRRYRNATMDEVSDPELWMVLNHGQEDESTEVDESEL